jgi:hypothetical protein
MVASKGYPLDEATWEPLDSLLPGSEELLTQFYKKHPELNQEQGNTWERKNNEIDKQTRKKKQA